MVTENIKALAIKVLQRNKQSNLSEDYVINRGNFEAKNEDKGFPDVSIEIKKLEESELEEFKERAAIMEFNGNMSREEAEKLALERILYKRRHLLN